MSVRSTLLDADAPGGLTFVQFDFIDAIDLSVRSTGILKI
jgi:hypothetical protein